MNIFTHPRASCLRGRLPMEPRVVLPMPTIAAEDIEDLNNLERAVLAVLYAPATSLAPGVPVKGKTRLMKLMFLLSRPEESGGKDAVVDTKSFRADKFGPYSPEVEEAIAELGYREWLTVGSTAPRVIALSPTGLGAARQVWETLSPEVKARIFQLKHSFNAKPIMELLYYVYSRYPDFTTESEIRSEVLD